MYILLIQASLPLAKLCAMVTMQKQGEANIQSFSLPLTVLAGDEVDGMRQDRVRDTGLLDVTVKYQQVVSRRLKEGQTTLKEDDNQICLSLEVIQACGLKVNGLWTSFTISKEDRWQLIEINYCHLNINMNVVIVTLVKHQKGFFAYLLHHFLLGVLYLLLFHSFSS